MSSITRPKLFLAATAVLVAVPAASALLASGHDAHLLFGVGGARPSLVKLNANGGRPFSELDKLRARRLSLRRPEPEADTAAAAEGHDAEDAAHDSLTAGLEYLYEAGEERHSDDFFHLILMPSTFSKDNMSVEHATYSCADVLGISSEKAHDISLFAKHQGFSCLGTWTREECLSMGEELASRDLDCRVIPFNGGRTVAPAPASFPEIHDVATPSPKKAPVEDFPLLSFTS